MRTLVKICVAALLTAGCAHFRVAPDGIPPSTHEEARRVHAMAWGALEPKIAPRNCEGNGLASVTIKVTVVDFLVSAATLGFWTPVTVRWTCAKPSGVLR